jgi:undecaprenyl-diphosphatase
LEAGTTHMNPLDSWIVSHINVFARKSWLFDQAVAFISVNYLIKGGVLMTLVWWAWFRTDDRSSRDREHLVATIFSCAVALVVGRMMVLVLPFRVRPLHEFSLNFVKPYGVAEEALAKLASFPSDHAVLFVGLAVGLFFISRAAGMFALLYTIIFILLPRLYLGLHYPSDILVGGAVGALIVWLGNTYLPARKDIQWLTSLSWSRPMYFYPVLFLATYQIADLFENSRAIVVALMKLVR